MDIRKAVSGDLPALRQMYSGIVEHMRTLDINIWNEYYPHMALPEDIVHGRLYVACGEGGVFLGAFALCASAPGERHITWEAPGDRVIYIERLGVNASYMGRGFAGAMLREAEAAARLMQARYLRLFVVEENLPAIKLYLKNGYAQRDGIYEDMVAPSRVLKERGFEKRLVPL